MATTTHAARGGPAVGGTASTSFAHGSGQVDSSIVVEWDFDNDGDFSETVEDTTTYMMSLETTTGRDYPSSLTGQASPGQFRATYLNDDDRFSYFNTSSPLATAPYSLRTGRKVRVRTSDAVADDPVLLARDRFNRTDGTLGTAEIGGVWTQEQSPYLLGVANGAAVPLTPGASAAATVDVGATDHYAQVVVSRLAHDTNQFGVMVRWTDINNYSLAYLDLNGLHIRDVNAGVYSIEDDYLFDPWDGCVIGLGVVDQTLTGYLNGVPVTEHTLTGPINGTEAGIAVLWGQWASPPRLNDFHVWDKVAAEVEGILWTGTVESVEPRPQLGSAKVATVAAEGVLKKVAGANVASPRVPLGGAPTGFLVGDVLARARVLHPPVPLDAGNTTTGPVGIPDGNAIQLARMFEETERGFIHETNEGQVGYDDAAARVTTSAAAVFSDAPGAQFGYSAIAPLDHKGQIINKVTAGVAADAPSGISVTQHNGFPGTHVDITIPTVTAGDLLVLFVANSQNGGQEWLNPIWWDNHRDLKKALGTRVYSHWCDGTETGTTVRFRTYNGSEGGLWEAQLFRIQGWHQSTRAGVAMGDPVSGSTPGAMVHGWGRQSTLFIFCQGTVGAATGGLTVDNYREPAGYGNFLGSTTSGATDDLDVALSSLYKIDCVDSEAPGEYVGMSNSLITESFLFAVRGYNGPHTKATLEDPNTVGGEGRFVTVEDVDSQDDHNTIRTHESASNLFSTEAAAEAYGDSVLAAYADDRPIVTLSFPATKNAAYRAQAIRRRVGDKVHVEASGVTGLGIDGDFFIENISHRWLNAGKHWECTWQLSPA